MLAEKFVIKYSVMGKRMAFDCLTASEAAIHAADIGSFDGVTDLKIEREFDEHLNCKIKESPYEIDK